MVDDTQTKKNIFLGGLVAGTRLETGVQIGPEGTQDLREIRPEVAG
jgi:hypothetical protein